MDYNIYIHDKTNGSQKPTKPRRTGGTNTTSKQDGSKGDSIGGNIPTLANIKNGIKKNIPAAGKIGIALLVVKKAAEITMKAIDVIEPFVTRETGDYRFNIAWNNAKATINTLTNPIGSVLNAMTTTQVITLVNKRLEQQRLLIGDAEVNAWERKV